jgi:DAK2 domain fusion protein YloV
MLSIPAEHVLAPNAVPAPAAINAPASSDPGNDFLRKYPLEQPLETLDGADLHALLNAAHDWLAFHHELVNRLNVFPVPDGDTGTNMLLTIKAACAAAKARGGQTVESVIVAAADGALRGSRGNSGVILGQILRGLSQALAQKARVSAHDLAQGIRQAAEVAYKSVPEPVEGTILTVIREMSQAATTGVETTRDLRALFAQLVEAADRAVQRTPELLPVLKQAGVVDSGGKGLFFVFEGMHRALLGKGAQATVNAATTVEQQPEPKGQRPLPPIRWGFDVQFLIEKPNQQLAHIRQAIAEMGEFPLVEGDQDLVKVHVHVFDPGLPLSYAVQVGFISDVVVENLDDMVARSEEKADRETGRQEDKEQDSSTTSSLSPGLPVSLSSSSSPLVEDIGLVAVAPGAGFAAIFQDLGVGAVVEGGQGANPSTAELAEAMRSLPNHRVILLPNNSNIILTAQQAAELVQQEDDQRRVLVVPSKTAPQGISAILAFNPALDDVEKMAAHLHERMGLVDTGEVTQAIRNAEFDGVTVEVGDFIGLHDGRLVTSGHTLTAVVLSLLVQMAADESELITIYYGDFIATDAAENLIEIVRTHYPEQNVELAYGGQSHYHYILSTE